MARPKLVIDEEQVKKLAAINCSYAEMAAVLDCNESTLLRRYAEVIQKGRANGKMSLKRKQYELAMGGNVTMLIWLGKQLLDQREPAIEVAQIKNLQKEFSTMKPQDVAKELRKEAEEIEKTINPQ